VIRLGVRVAREDAAPALAALLAFSPAGVEEVDIDAGTLEYALYGAAEELPGDGELARLLGGGLAGTDRRELADDWSERWREFHRPASVGDRLWVRAPWHDGAPAGLVDLVVEPGQAFGTGAHATTRLCLELLVALERAGQAGGSLLDVGCGSGVLAIAAAKLGFDPIVAIDNDPLAVQAAAANAQANGVRIGTDLADLAVDELPAVQTVVANLLLDPLLTLARRLERPPAVLIVSGLLERQGEALAPVLRMRERERRGEGGWVAILYERGPDPRVSS
jgi:ribosomal protein L11 methyltransferase